MLSLAYGQLLAVPSAVTYHATSRALVPAAVPVLGARSLALDCIGCAHPVALAKSLDPFAIKPLATTTIHTSPILGLGHRILWK